MNGKAVLLLKTFIAILAVQSFLYAASGGKLTVRTDPEGVEVWLDERYIGDSPIIDKKLKPGRYTLKLIDPIQHASIEEDVFIQAGENTMVEKTIVGKFGSLNVTTEPKGAVVSISTALGKTPVSNGFMNPGKYRLEIKYPGKYYEPVVEDIVIPRGKSVDLNKTLVKKNPFDKKALVRLGLGAGAVGGFVWALIQQGNYRYEKEKLKNNPFRSTDNRDSAAAQRTLGIVLGSVCVLGFEVLAFF